MTSSELAFLGLGLLLGAATGAALIVVLGSRTPRREIRVTVTRDALPRRSGTLSHDAFVTRAGEPAPGGPGDRRWFDRGPLGLGQPILEPAVQGPPARSWLARDDHPRDAPISRPDRTAVPSVAAVGITIQPEADPELAALRPQPAAAVALERILKGEHRAMVEVIDRVAGEDGARRREWEVLLDSLVEALADVAVQESVIDFPMGTPFWDTFTVEQCRRIVTSLASMGFRYDGRSGWREHHVPIHRDLAQALADIGVDPRRVRAWPTQPDIAGLFVGARPAPEELLAAAGPDYTAADVAALIADRAAELGNLWLAWEAVRPVLFEERAAEALAEA